MDLSKFKHQVILLVDTRVEDGFEGSMEYGHIQLRAARLQDGHVRGLQGHYPHSDSQYYEDFMISNQRDSYQDPGESSYSWKFDYRAVYAADPRRVKKMYKTMSRIERALKRQERQHGPAVSFADYVMRVSKAMKVKLFFFYERHSLNYDDCCFKVLGRKEASRELAELDCNLSKMLPRSNGGTR